MMRLLFSLGGRLLLCLVMMAQSAVGAPSAPILDEQLLSEQKNFVECLSCVYSPAWWFSYNDSLYFQPRNEAQARQLEAMKAARSRYLALTNQDVRHALAARLIAETGISPAWQAKILLPLSATNQTLTPTLARPLRPVPKYKVLQSLASGDALIQDGASVYFVMNFGRGADDAARTNALLIKEGVKSFSAGGGVKVGEGFSDVALRREED